MTNSFKARSTLNVGSRSYEIWSMAALPPEKVARLPYSLKILLENLLRFEDGVNVTRADIDALRRAAPSLLAAPGRRLRERSTRLRRHDRDARWLSASRRSALRGWS